MARFRPFPRLLQLVAAPAFALQRVGAAMAAESVDQFLALCDRGDDGVWRPKVAEFTVAPTADQPERTVRAPWASLLTMPNLGLDTATVRLEKAMLVQRIPAAGGRPGGLAVRPVPRRPRPSHARNVMVVASVRTRTVEPTEAVARIQQRLTEAALRSVGG